VAAADDAAGQFFAGAYVLYMLTSLSRLAQDMNFHHTLMQNLFSQKTRTSTLLHLFNQP